MVFKRDQAIKSEKIYTGYRKNPTNEPFPKQYTISRDLRERYLTS
jgi:hypothetical protein